MFRSRKNTGDAECEHLKWRVVIGDNQKYGLNATWEECMECGEDRPLETKLETAKSLDGLPDLGTEMRFEEEEQDEYIIQIAIGHKGTLHCLTNQGRIFAEADTLGWMEIPQPDFIV